jgi:raffinose/stachyose/melibiose transport system permease protein
MQVVGTEARRRGSGKWAGQTVRYVVCALIALIVLVPIVTAVVGGFRTNAQLVNRPFAWPDPFVWTNYTDILRSDSFWRQVLNSTVIMLLTTIVVLSVSSMAAFVVARLPFRGRGFAINFFMLGLLFPVTVAILPLYILIRQLDLLDSLWGVVLPQVAFAIPISVLILRNFFLAIPRDLEDAAYVDGATPAGFFLRILLPLMRPGLAAVGVLAMVTSWNNFFLPLLVLNREDAWTLPLGVMQFQGQYSTDWARVLAFVTLALVPAIAFYLVAERQIIAGLTAGSVKE